MRTLLALAVVVAILFATASSKNVIIVGGDGTATKGSPASPDYGRGPSDSPIKEFRDPSRYSNPWVSFDFSRPDDSKDNYTSSRYGESVSYSFIFDMSGDINGTGNYSEWRSLNNGAGMKAKQAAIANSGRIEVSRADYIASDYSTHYDIRNILYRNYVSFLGGSYRELESTLADGECIKNYIRAGAIRKESAYYDINQNVHPDIDYIWGNTSIRSTEYLLAARYVGTTDFKVRYLNSSLIEEVYTGQVILDRRISGNRTLQWPPLLKESWLQCCNNPA